MPIQELKCKTCGHVFDFFKLRSFDKPECPKCEEVDEKCFAKQVSKGTRHIFKSGKWFKEGY